MKTFELSGPASSEEAICAGQTEETIVTRGGKPVAMIVPFDQDDLEWYARESDPGFIKSIARARQQAKSGNVVSHEQLKSELGI